MSGSTIGTLGGAIVGGVIGYLIGGPAGAYVGLSLGATIGGGVGQALDPQKGLTGPDIKDLTVQTSTYGAVMPRLYGTVAVFGNIFWLKNNKLTEVETTSGGKGSLTGSAEATTYSYYATFALGLCICKTQPIEGIRRIWIGPKLFYDAGSTIRATIMATAENAEYLTLYTGSDTQLPDSRIQADVGVANTPAYRGLAYLVFEDFPLADYANSLPIAQIKVEVVADATYTYLLEEVTEFGTAVGAGNMHMAISGDYLYVTTKEASTLEIFDIKNRENPIQLSALTLPGRPYTIQVLDDYLLFIGSGDSDHAYVVDISSKAAPTVLMTVPNVIGGGLHAVAAGTINGATTLFVASAPDSKVYSYVITETTYTLLDSIAVDTAPQGAALSGTTLLVSASIGASISSLDVSDPSNLAILDTLPIDAYAQDVNIEGDYAYVSHSLGNTVTVVDFSDPSNLSSPKEIDTASAYVSAGFLTDEDRSYLVTASGSADTLEIWNKTTLGSTFLVGDITVGDNPQAVATTGYYIYVANGNDNTVGVYFFKDHIIQEEGVPLSEIVERESVLSNLLTASDLNVTSLTPTVRGFKASNIGQIRKGLESLQIPWPFDAVQAGYKIKFILRGLSSIDSATSGLLDARKSGDDFSVMVETSREMDSQLPARVTLNYLDPAREYDAGEQYAERINTDAINLQALELPIVLISDEAAQAAQTLLYMYWLERYDISFKLPPTYSHLEPADIITITTDQATFDVRLTSIQYTANGILECKGKYNSAAIYSPSALVTGEDGSSTGATLGPAGSSKLILMDIPMLTDSADTPGFVLAMTGYYSSWPGGVLYRSVDGGQSWAPVQGVVTPGAKIGHARGSKLSTHDGCTLDKSGQLTISMLTGALSSVTESQMFAGSNWFAYGADGRWEIIAAQNCVLQGDGTYLLSDFLRGQFGTEWATSQHANYDSLVYLDTTSLYFVDMNSTSIGVSYQYKAPTKRTPIEDADAESFSYDGVNLECLSPCHATGNRHPTTKDWTITWTRRSRYAGWRNLVDAPLGEASESYEVEVYSDSGYTSVLRTLTSTSATVSYTSAQQVTDFGINQPTLYLKIYQLSATVGRGYPLTVELTRADSLYAVLSLDMEGADGGTTFTDASASAHTVTANGNAHTETDWAKIGSSSAYFDGSGDYLSIPDSADFAFGTKGFKISFWMKAASSGDREMIFGQRGTVSSYQDYPIMLQRQLTTQKIRLWHTVTLGVLAEYKDGTAIVFDNMPHFVSVERLGTSLKVYVDGVLDISQTLTPGFSFLDSSYPFCIGRCGNLTSFYYSGYIDNFVIEKEI